MPLNYFRSRRLGRALLGRPSEFEEPISAEIFSVERLEHYAETLAKTQEISPATSAGVSLRRRLRANAGNLHAAYHTLIAGIRDDHAVSPAAEWLVDNFYIVDEHMRAIRRDLPAGYYRQLPKLANGPLRGYPRVYGIAWAIIAHSDNRFELDTLFRFCRAYQRVQPLTIGELWAIAITLRVVLIENLSRLPAASSIGFACADGRTSWPTSCCRTTAEPTSQSRHLPPIEAGPLPSAFGAQLFQRLRDHDPEATPALQWLHRPLPRSRPRRRHRAREHQRQGAVNVSVRNIITSLRLISSVDWAKFFESVSLVDELLRDAAVRLVHSISPAVTCTATRSKICRAARLTPK